MKIVNKNFSVLFFFSLKVKNENTRVLLGTRVSKKNSYSELGFKKKTRTFANPKYSIIINEVGLFIEIKLR